MATNEEYLDNLLKAFEEEEKAREKENRIPQEKKIITDDDDYIQSLLDEVEGMADDASVADSDMDVLSMLNAENDAGILSAMNTENDADSLSAVNTENDADNLSAVNAENDTDILSLLDAESDTDILNALSSENDADIFSMLNAENNVDVSGDTDNADILSLLNSMGDDDGLDILQEENKEAGEIDLEAALFEDDSENEWKGDLDELLAAAVDKLDENQDFFGETDTISPMSDDVDITQLIDGLDDADGSLAEISELLKKSDNNEMLEGFAEPEQEQAIQELTGEISQKKKRAFSWKKKKTSDEAVNALEDGEDIFDTDAENADAGVEKKGRKAKKAKKEKKDSGRLGQFWQTLLEDDESESEAENEKTALTDENDEILKELDKEDKKGKKKKEKKEKKKKDKKKGLSPEEGIDENIGDEEGDGKGKKKKKKREKKRKEKAEGIPAPKEKSKKVLSRKAFMVLVAFCASLIAIVVCLSAFLPDYVEKKRAREAFYQGNYEEAYVLLFGKNLNESDALLLDRVEVVLQLDRKLEAYYFNDEAGKQAEALDALMQGVSYYYELPDKNEFGAGDELKLSYQKILDILNQKYGVDETKAIEMVTCDDIRYSQWIYSVAEGMDFGNQEEQEAEPEPEGPKDILPEEEDIIKTETGN